MDFRSLFYLCMGSSISPELFLLLNALRKSLGLQEVRACFKHLNAMGVFSAVLLAAEE